jgi:hypothetical protein
MVSTSPPMWACATDKLCLSLFRIDLGFGRVPIHPKVRRNLCFGVLLPGPQATEQSPDEGSTTAVART